MSVPIQEIFLFTPLSIPNCCLWLDGGDRTTLFSDSAGTLPVSTGSITVAHWKDKSTSNNNATNTANQPFVSFASQNSLPTVSFTGTQYLNLTSTSLPNGGTDATYFFVCKTTTASFVQVFFSHGPTPAEVAKTPQFFYASGQIYADTYGSNAIYDNATLTNQFLTLSITRNGSLSGWLHGSSFIGSNNSPLSFNTGTGFATLGVGRVSATLDYYFRGEMAEVVIYNSNLNTVDRQLLEGYLANKWGINRRLPSDHPYIGYRPLTSNFPLPLVLMNPLLVRNLGSPPYTNFPTVLTESFFSPKSINNLSLWLDAADFGSFTMTGSNISQWNDKSGNAKHAVQSTGSNQPTYSNSNVFFDGAAEYMEVSALTVRPANIFAVVRANNTTSGQMHIVRYGRNPGTSFEFLLRQTNADVVGIWGYGTSSNLLSLTGSGSGTTSRQILTSTWNGTVANLYVNGSSVASSNRSDSQFVGTSLIRIGASFSTDSDTASPSLLWNGSMNELLLFNQTPSQEERQKLEGYLAWKWGIQASLPSSHPFKNIPPSP
jgi:hypothetical protein